MQDVLCIGSAAALYRIGTAAKKGQPRDLPALASALSALDHCYSDESFDICPYFRYIYLPISPFSDSAWKAFPSCAGECGTRAPPAVLFLGVSRRRTTSQNADIAMSSSFSAGRLKSLHVSLCLTSECS